MVDISFSVHVDNKKKYILILGEGPTQGLNDTTRTAEKKYSINFTESRKLFCLSLLYNGANSYLFVNNVEIDKFKAKDSEINAILLCLENNLKDFSVDNMKKTGFYGYADLSLKKTPPVWLPHAKTTFYGYVVRF